MAHSPAPSRATDLPAFLVSAYRTMLTIRLFEDRCVELASEGLVAGSVHVCSGQEAIPVGGAAALGDDDQVLATYRGHGWALACGVPLSALLGEICQRAEGINGGRAGSPYLSAPGYRLLGENSIVGAAVPIAAGVALASSAQGSDGVAVVSIGDGAMSQGSVHEALVLAAARNLPMVVVCENNGWAEMTAAHTIARIPDLADRAVGYGIPGHVVDGLDPLAVHDALAPALDRARAGAGPTLLECKTVRLLGHYNRDIEHYRPKEDSRLARDREPIAALRRRLLDLGHIDQRTLDDIARQAREDVDRATDAVREMAEPDGASAGAHVHAPMPAIRRDTPPLRPAQGGEVLSYVNAVTAALRRELDERPETLVYGEDVGNAGGIFGASRGLQREFGAERVFDTPIAESAILGSAVGAAMKGMRPIVEIMWADFLLVALDQLINQAANVRYVSRSKLTAPLVVRTQQGVTPGSCAQHSQSLEALLAHIPGLRVGLASTSHDAYTMLRAAVADPDPCILFESRALYQLKGLVDPSVEEHIGRARLHREGADVAILSWGAMLHEALGAAEVLADRGIECSVLDLRWLSPLDDDAIDYVVRRGRGRVLVAHEANLTGGFGAEIAARIQERHFDALDGPVGRVGSLDARTPSAPALQRVLVPDRATIVRRALSMINGVPADDAFAA